MATNIIEQLNLLQRVVAPTPSFFKKLRSAGLILAAVSGGLMAAPVPLPEVITQIAGYMAVAGGVISAVSQTTVDEEVLNDGRNAES